MDVQYSETLIPVAGVRLAADITVPADPAGLVLFAHGSGSSRHSPRNRAVAHVLNRDGFGTVLADLLTPDEEQVDDRTGELRFDIDLLADRLTALVDWAGTEQPAGAVPVGLFGASTGAAAALVTAAARPERVRAVVSRGGRPDLAGAALARVRAATLLLVGGMDQQVLELNERALAELGATAELRVIADATHLFPEPGALEQVAHQASGWFTERLGGRP